MKEHLQLRAVIDGRIQAKATSISVELDGKRVPVETLEGLDGYTSGPGQLSITANWAIEKGGPEFDFVDAIAIGSFHDVQIPYGKKTIATKGYFTNGGLSQSVGASTEGTATFIGKLNPPK